MTMPRWLARVLEEMPAPRMPRMPRLFKRGSHHAPVPPMRVRLKDLIHGERQAPEDYQLSAFPGEPWPVELPVGYWPRYLTPAAAAEVSAAERDGGAVQA